MQAKDKSNFDQPLRLQWMALPQMAENHLPLLMDVAREDLLYAIVNWRWPPVPAKLMYKGQMKSIQLHNVLTTRNVIQSAHARGRHAQRT